MQRLACEVADALGRAGGREVVALGRSQAHLAWFLPLALLRTAAFLARGRVRRVVCGDPLVLAALRPVLWIRRPPVAVVVHGLDLLYRLAPYRWLVRRALERADRVVAISEATRRETIACGVPPDRVVVVNPGLSLESGDEPSREEAATRLRDRLGIPRGGFVLLTVGRLVPRKGVAWFVEHVLPTLPAHHVYVVVGDGPDRPAVEDAAVRSGTRRRVLLLGSVDEELRRTALRGSDLFVMPNVPVPGDMEGFGLVAVEAAAAGTPVVASRLEGITDAVGDAGADLLCPPLDVEAFRGRILELAEDPEALRGGGCAAQREALERFSADRFAQELLAALGEGP